MKGEIAVWLIWCVAIVVGLAWVCVPVWAVIELVRWVTTK